MSEDTQTEETAEPSVEKRTYEVELSGTVFTSVQVEAADEDEAHDLAKEAVAYGWSWDDDVLYHQVESVREVGASE